MVSVSVLGVRGSKADINFESSGSSSSSVGSREESVETVLGSACKDEDSIQGPTNHLISVGKWQVGRYEFGRPEGNTSWCSLEVSFASC